MLGQRKRLLEDYTEAETQMADLTRAQAKAERDLEPVRARRVRDQQRVDSGAVTDPKTLNGLVAEIEHLGRRISDLEDAELEVMEELEQTTGRFEGLKSRRTDLETEIRALMATRDEQLAGLDGQLQHAQAKRETVAEKVSAALVTYYERIRDKHGGIGAAELIERRCGGCRLELNAADLRSFAAAAPDEVLLCEECGRILIRTPRSALAD